MRLLLKAILLLYMLISRSLSLASHHCRKTFKCKEFNKLSSMSLSIPSSSSSSSSMPSSSLSSSSSSSSSSSKEKYTVSYITDIEGNLDYWARCIEFSKVLSGKPGNVELKDNCGFIFGGDVCDRGIGDITIINDMISLKERYPDRVNFILGNRDINKLRLPVELSKVHLSQPPKVYWIPEDQDVKNVDHSVGDRMKWILLKTMGSPEAFENRRTELKNIGKPYNDDDVGKSFVDLVSPNPMGKLTKYLQQANIAKVLGNVLVVHGAVLDYNIGWVPPYSPDGESSIVNANESKSCSSLNEWIEEINKFATTEMNSFVKNTDDYIKSVEEEMKGILPHNNKSKEDVEEIVNNLPYRANWAAVGGYLHPQPGSSLLQYGMGWLPDRSQNPSVIYATYGTDSNDSNHPSIKVADWLKESNIRTVFVGHQPRGDCPYILDNNDVQIISGDTSYAVNALWDHKGIDEWKSMGKDDLVFQEIQENDNILNQRPPSNSTRGAVVSETLIEVPYHLPEYKLEEPLIARVICRGILSDNSTYEFDLEESRSNKYVGRKNCDGWTVKASNVKLSEEAILKSNKPSPDDNNFYLISYTEGFTVKNKYVHHSDIDKEMIKDQ